MGFAKLDEHLGQIHQREHFFCAQMIQGFLNKAADARCLKCVFGLALIWKYEVLITEKYKLVKPFSTVGHKFRYDSVKVRKYMQNDVFTQS